MGSCLGPANGPDVVVVDVVVDGDDVVVED